MLALMAGRNAGAGVTLVKEGKVSPIVPVLSPNPSPHSDPVAQLQLRPLLLNRAPTKPNRALPNPHSRLPRFRAHSPSNPLPTNRLRPHPLHLHRQPRLAAQPNPRSIPHRRAP